MKGHLREPKPSTSAAPSDSGCACAAARQAARLLTQLYDSKLRSAGMEAPQFALLMTLAKHGACSQADLGRRYALDKTTVSRNLKLLESKGWIESTEASDKRQRQFTLTAEGFKKLNVAKPEWKSAQNRLRSAMTGEQWDAMFQVFKTVTEAARTLQNESGQEAASHADVGSK